MTMRGWTAGPARGGFAPREGAPVPGGSRTYRMGRGLRVFLYFGALFFVAMAAMSARVDGTIGWRIALGLSFLVFAGACVAGAEQTRRLRVIIDDAGIEYVEWRRPRRLAIDAIAGVRMLQGKGQGVLVFEPRDPAAKKLKVPWMGTFDTAFVAWLRGLPDLDAAERARSEAALLAAPALGSSPAERKVSLARAKAISRAMSLAGFAAALWAFLYPRPYAWAVATAFAMPLVALALMLVWRGAFQMMGTKNDARPMLTVPVMLPGLAATMRAFDFDLLAPGQLLAPAVVVGAVVAATALLADDAVRRKPVFLVVLVPWFAAQAAGALTVANCFRDPSIPVSYDAEVRSKHVTRGKGAAWYLELAPWGPRVEPEQVKVWPDLYDSVSVGDRVRIRVRDGRLWMPWFRVAGRSP